MSPVHGPNVAISPDGRADPSQTTRMDTLTFIHDIRYDDLPLEVQRQAQLCLLDLCGIAAGGATTRLSQIICDHAAGQFPGRHALPLDGRTVSATGLALALGMSIDALDGHDGYNPAKGHVGCGLFPAVLAVAREAGTTTGTDFLTTIVLGYELGSRLAVALHATAEDYHTSGAWIAVAAAAAGARLLNLDETQTAHALGIAEYHGPRSQMMRCIDHPTMVKDGSGWGAMAGVSAALLARDGFTGAPALTITQPPDIWTDLGTRWLILEQYFKPYPVCRWAQAPIEAALTLRDKHTLTAQDISTIEVATFHEATRLATTHPKTTEEAQYSTSFPTAIALARGGITAADLSDDALHDPEILRLSEAMHMTEDAHANAQFPAKRLARVTLTTRDGTQHISDWTTPKWDADAPPTPLELQEKFHALADPALGPARAQVLANAIETLPETGPDPLYEQLRQPINRATTPAKAS